MEIPCNYLLVKFIFSQFMYLYLIKKKRNLCTCKSDRRNLLAVLVYIYNLYLYKKWEFEWYCLARRWLVLLLSQHHREFSTILWIERERERELVSGDTVRGGREGVKSERIIL